MKYLSLFLFFVFVSACNSSEKPGIGNETGSDVISRVEIPFREHGYRQFNNTIIGSDDAFVAFVESVQAQDQWNNKSDFLNTLTAASIDYTQDNLLLFRMTESSGSIALLPMEPTVEDNTAAIEVARSVPGIGTDDMAYYALAYTLPKSIDAIHISVGDQEHILNNQEGSDIRPQNCVAWFDGCNECSKGIDGMTMCTLKACTTFQEMRCREWAD